MKLLARFFFFLFLFCSAWFCGWGQSMVPIIQQTQSTIGQIEKDGDVVDVALYDYIFKDNNSTFTYEYQFYSSDSYTVRVIGDETRNTNLAIRIYRLVGSNWQQVKQVVATGKAAASLPFRPPGSERFRIEVSCDLTGGYTSSCFGLIIVRVE